MSVKQFTQFECDICQGKQSTNNESPPKGWIQFSLDGVLDRTWIEKVVCKDCLKEIEAAKKYPKNNVNGAPL